MMMPAESAVWFPDLSSGIPHRAVPYLQAIISTAWKLAIDGRALAEDMEGGADEPALLAVLKLKMAELLLEIDLDLRGLGQLDEDHMLPLALERGLSETARISGPELIEALGLAGGQADMARLWEEILQAFPGEVPNPLAPEGQGPALRALRAWTKACKAAGVDDAFLVPLIKAI
jgi:hypothetical protein